MTVSGEVLRAWRRSRGWDKAEMARRLRRAAGDDPVPEPGSLVRMIRYWEIGQRKLSERHELLCAKALGIDPDVLAHGPDGLGLRHAPTRVAESVPAPDSAGRLGLLRRLEYGSAVDGQVLETLRSETQNLRLLDRHLGAPIVIGKTSAHVEHLTLSMRYALSGEVRRSIAGILAESLTLAGWQCVDTGQLPKAWDYYEDAKVAAREAGDVALTCHAAAEQAYVLAELGEVGKALGLIQDTYATYRRTVPGRLCSWVKAAEAEIAAMNGDERAVRHALEAAAMNLPRDGLEDQLPYLTLDELHLIRWRGSCMSYFGDAATLKDLLHVLAVMDPSFTRAAAGVHCDLGRAFLSTGDRQEGRLHLEMARQLAFVTGSVRQQRKADQLFMLAE